MNNIPIDNSEANLVLLSYEDHCKVHKLAYLCTTDKMKRNMAYAYHRLTEGEILDNSYWRGKNNPFYGKTHSNEVRKKMSESHKGHVPFNKGMKMSEEFCNKISKAKENISEETRKKMSESHKGKPMSEANRKALYEAHKGKKQSVETCKKISESLKGRVFSEEHRRKLREAAKKRCVKKNEVNNV